MFKGKYIIISKIEYKVILDICCEFEFEGFEIIYFELFLNMGLIIFEMVEVVICLDIIFVLFMMVNNEIGFVIDVVVIGEIICVYKIFFYVDVV